LRFQVLKAAIMKVDVFWVVALCSLIETYRLLEVLTAFIITSETSVNFYKTTRRKNSEDSLSIM